MPRNRRFRWPQTLRVRGLQKFKAYKNRRFLWRQIVDLTEFLRILGHVKTEGFHGCEALLHKHVKNRVFHG